MRKRSELFKVEITAKPPVGETVGGRTSGPHVNRANPRHLAKLATPLLAWLIGAKKARRFTVLCEAFTNELDDSRLRK
jgi:hypothetical protein